MAQDLKKYKIGYEKHFGVKELASFCIQYVPISECVPFYVYIFFLKLQLNVIDFSFCIRLLRDHFSFFFALEMIVGLEMLNPIISVNQSTSMVNYCFPIWSLSKYLKLFERPMPFARRYITGAKSDVRVSLRYVTKNNIF